MSQARRIASPIRSLAASLFQGGALLIAATTLLGPPPALASEIDSVTHRTYFLSDATPNINTLIQRKLSAAAHAATEQNDRSCNPDTFRNALYNETHTYAPINPIELALMNDHRILQGRNHIHQSIFRDFPVSRFPHMWTVDITMANLLLAGSDFIGTDKIGHFLDEGWTYYRMIHREGKSLRQAFQWGLQSERGKFGLAMNGIFSWGDLVANYHGLKFWEEVVPRWYHCRNGRWSRVQNFDLGVYIDSGWDEAINCPRFRNASLARGVERRTADLEALRGEPLQCPIRPDDCEMLREKYGENARYLISPTCR